MPVTAFSAQGLEYPRANLSTEVHDITVVWKNAVDEVRSADKMWQFFFHTILPAVSTLLKTFMTLHSSHEATLKHKRMHLLSSCFLVQALSYAGAAGFAVMCQSKYTTKTKGQTPNAFCNNNKRSQEKSVLN